VKKVTLYTKEQCPLCEEALAILKVLQAEIPFEIDYVDIYQDDQLLEKHQLKIPVIEINNDEVDYGKISYEKVRKRLL
jgi:glutaredoxin